MTKKRRKETQSLDKVKVGISLSIQRNSNLLLCILSSTDPNQRYSVSSSFSWSTLMNPYGAQEDNSLKYIHQKTTPHDYQQSYLPVTIAGA